MAGRSPLIAQPAGAPIRPAANPRHFFDGVQAAFERATRPGQPKIFVLQLADHVVRLEFAGLGLWSFIVPALQHLAVATESQAHLTVRLWDTTSTGVYAPPPPWGPDDYQPDGSVRGYATDGFRTYFNFGSCALTLLDEAGSTGYFWVRSPDLLTTHERGAPLRVLLSDWLGPRGLQMVHAGAFGVPGAGGLVAGPSGSGKSNTALAALDAGLRYIGDDYCLVGASPRPTVHSLYASAKAHTADLERLAFLLPALSNPRRLPDEKALFILGQQFSGALQRQLPLRAIYVARVTNAPSSRLRPATAAEALNGLLPSTLELLPSLSRGSIELLFDLVRRVRAFHLDLGADRQQLVALLQASLAEAVDEVATLPRPA